MVEISNRGALKAEGHDGFVPDANQSVAAEMTVAAAQERD
jgi:hypothetical protein